MKYCRKCNTAYSQKGTKFCRNDGILLVEDSDDSRITLPLEDIKESRNLSFWLELLTYDLELYDKGISSPVIIAGEYVLLGDLEKALEWLEEAYSLRNEELLYLNINPIFNELNSDPRFQNLLQRVESSYNKDINQ